MTPAAPPDMRRHIRLGGVTAFLLIVGFFGWATLTSLSGAVLAPGLVEVDRNRQIVQHAEGGTVAEIAVAEGAQVAAGAVLLRLEGGSLRAERAAAATLLTDLRARIARLAAEAAGQDRIDFPADLATVGAEATVILSGQRALFEARRASARQLHAQLARRAEQTARQIDGITAQRAALLRQAALLQAELAAQETLLAKGLAQMARVLALQREDARLAGLLGELEAAEAEAQVRILEAEGEVLRLDAQHREAAQAELRDLTLREGEVRARVALLDDRIAGLEVRAPVAGVVFGLRVTTPRAVIRAAEPLLYVIPQDRPLIVALRVGGGQAAAVHIGQSVRIVLPPRGLGPVPEVAGRIALISADAYQDEGTNRPFFRVDVHLNRTDLAKIDAPLLPGMQVEGFITTPARTPLAYLLAPFTIYFDRALRES